MAILWILAVLPALVYPCVCWAYWRVINYKRYTVEQALTPIGAKQQYQKLYIPASHPAHDERDPVASLFEITYHLPSYIVAILMNGLLVYVASLLCLGKAGLSLGISADLENAVNRIPSVVIAGVAGAYLWGIYEILRRYWSAELSANSLHAIWLRLLVAAALSIMVDGIARENVGAVVAFAIGAFPLSTLSDFLREHVTNRLQIRSTAEPDEPPTLNKLQGLTKDTINRLREENIDSTPSLAYADPIELLLRTNFKWIAILDMIDQAALFIYVGDKGAKLRSIGLRGVIEAMLLWETLQLPKDDPQTSVLLAEISSRLEQSETATRNLLATMYHDAHFQFLRSLWTGIYSAQLNSAGATSSAEPVDPAQIQSPAAKS